MQTIVLIGEKAKQEEYLESFKKSHNITPYLVVSYEDGFKIADARTVQKSLSVKLQQQEARLVIISDPTMDSQNALLKTLEELPLSTYIVFCVKTKESLLPTILSRSHIVNLGNFSYELDVHLVQLAASNNLHMEDIVLKYSNPTEADIETIIATLRHCLLENLSKPETVQKLFKITKLLSLRYSLAGSNNINKKMILDSILYSYKITP